MPPRNPVVVPLSFKFEAHKDHVVAVFEMFGGSVGLRFTSPEHILSFMNSLMEQAVKVWPDNEFIKEYLSED